MLGKSPKAYIRAPNEGKKERLSRERDKIKFVKVRFENRLSGTTQRRRAKVRHPMFYRFLECMN